VNLKNYSIDELKAELERREERKVSEPPQRIKDPDLSVIIDMCEAHVEEIYSGSYHPDNDFDVYLYEAVMNAFYGREFWEWKVDTIREGKA
jgi:hypothetical protein